jgi:hypothetical protein
MKLPSKHKTMNDEVQKPQHILKDSDSRIIPDHSHPESNKSANKSFRLILHLEGKKNYLRSKLQNKRNCFSPKKAQR